MFVRLELDIMFTKLGQDYVDTCERLTQLNLTEVQREVVHVVVETLQSDD